MLHLADDALARLVDDPPTPDEARHLQSCDVCRARLDEFRYDVEALRAMPRSAPPASEWVAIATALEGYSRWRRAVRLLGGAAAAGVVFLVGMNVGARRSPSEPELTFASTSRVSATQAAARLAAFEAALLTTREAATHAPQDSVLMAYERLTLSARDSLLRAVTLTSRKTWY
jgi:hypothetical protein